MTTNLNAIAGPSKQMSPASTISVSVSPKPEPESPEFIGDLSGLTAAATGDVSASGSGSGGAGAVNKSGLSVDENGDVVKVPAFLQKLFRWVHNSDFGRARTQTDDGSAWYRTQGRTR